MTFDRNPQPVSFIQPNVFHRTCLSIGKDDGLADQFGSRRNVVVQNI
jgi:hypothetical protein